MKTVLLFFTSPLEVFQKVLDRYEKSGKQVLIVASARKKEVLLANCPGRNLLLFSTDFLDESSIREVLNKVNLSSVSSVSFQMKAFNESDYWKLYSLMRKYFFRNKTEYFLFDQRCNLLARRRVWVINAMFNYLKTTNIDLVFACFTA
ncbi:MAG: hypothetical protein PHQ23_03225, partial [Candidatus Wallbacteria bacterium]|nr:hypothetical protein [Candidatus Wallbacteria bacterium]